jgi:hypothetical protein
MSARTTSAPSQTQLAPSELVSLFGAQFAPRGGKSATEAPHIPSTKQEDYTQLAAKIVAAALLADEQAGSIRLQAGAKKALFGLRTVQVVTAVAGGDPPPAPEGTWETRLYQALLKEKERTSEVQSLVFRLVPKSKDPFGWVIDVALGALRQRDLLEVTEERKLKVITIRHWNLPDSTAQLASQESPAEAQRLLTQAERDRPELWKLLVDQIKRGIKQNEEQSDTGGAGDV